MLRKVADRVRTSVKHVAFRAYSTAVAPAWSRRLAASKQQRISIVCYHRINDALKDDVSLSAEAFDRQIAFIRRNYPVATLPDLTQGRIDRSTKRPIVIITFDDGYRDNYELAAPILEKHAVRAAFFVSTGLIGTDRGFDHDWQRLKRAVPTMSWDNLRDLEARGHEIGAHTVNHVNLATVDEDLARHELVSCRDTIRHHLRSQHIPFAYCYGGRNDITEEGRALVRSLGFTCCLSCYGGTNAGAVDLFNIKRFGVNWAIGTAALQARLEGWGWH